MLSGRELPTKEITEPGSLFQELRQQISYKPTRANIYCSNCAKQQVVLPETVWQYTSSKVNCSCKYRCFLIRTYEATPEVYRGQRLAERYAGKPFVIRAR